MGIAALARDHHQAHPPGTNSVSLAMKSPMPTSRQLSPRSRCPRSNEIAAKSNGQTQGPITEAKLARRYRHGHGSSIFRQQG
jgi:hypothetical protein